MATEPRTPDHFLCLADRDRSTYRQLFARVREIKRAWSDDVDRAAILDNPRVAVLRTDDEDHLYRFAATSPVPVINGGSACGDPLQALTDLFTAEETFGFFGVFTFFGDGSKGLGRSLAEASGVLGVHVRIVGAAPPAIVPEVWMTGDPSAALRGAQVIVGDTEAFEPPLAAGAKNAIILNGLAARTDNRAYVETALLEAILVESPPPRLLTWRATPMSERMVLSSALRRIADEHMARDLEKGNRSVARRPTVEVFASWHRDDTVIVAFVFHYRLDVYHQSGSDEAVHYARTAAATFRDRECVEFAVTGSVEHEMSEGETDTYDDDEPARRVRDAAIAELGERAK